VFGERVWREQGIIGDEVPERSRQSELVRSFADPLREQPPEPQRAGQLHGRGGQRTGVRIDQPQMNLPFVAQAGAVHWPLVLIDQRDGNAASREFKRRRNPRQPGS
jgi:hypothetical protein